MLPAGETLPAFSGAYLSWGMKEPAVPCTLCAQCCQAMHHQGCGQAEPNGDMSDCRRQSGVTVEFGNPPAFDGGSTPGTSQQTGRRASMQGSVGMSKRLLPDDFGWSPGADAEGNTDAQLADMLDQDMAPEGGDFTGLTPDAGPEYGGDPDFAPDTGDVSGWSRTVQGRTFSVPIPLAFSNFQFMTAFFWRFPHLNIPCVSTIVLPAFVLQMHYFLDQHSKRSGHELRLTGGHRIVHSQGMTPAIAARPQRARKQPQLLSQEQARSGPTRQRPATASMAGAGHQRRSGPTAKRQQVRQRSNRISV